MTDSRRTPRAVKPKRVLFITTTLGCIRGDARWHVTDLNSERKTVQCPVCGTLNDIREAVLRGKQ